MMIDRVHYTSAHTQISFALFMAKNSFFNLFDFIFFRTSQLQLLQTHCIYVYVCIIICQESSA